MRTDPAAPRPSLAARLGRALVSVVVVAVAAVVLAGVLAFVALRSVDGPDLADLVLTENCVADVGEYRAELNPEQAANAALIAGLAERRGLPGRAATIALATAIQESDLRNLDYGDRDSLGLFQQRPSQGWGTPEQIMDPVYSTNTFYDALVEIDGYETQTVTDVAQEVQRSAFPLAYGDHEGEGRALASTLTGYSPADLSCTLAPVADSGAGTAAGSTNPAEPLGEDGLGAGARALAGDLGSWGPLDSLTVRAEPNPDGALAGRVLVLDATGSAEPDRYAWALAHTAVALAGTRDVLAVAVDEQVWLRDDGETGWQPRDQAVGEPGEGGDGEPSRAALLDALTDPGAGTAVVVVG